MPVFGDLDADGMVDRDDLEGSNNHSFEDTLYSQNEKFNAAADVNGDGRVTNTDLFSLGVELASEGASQAAFDSYDGVLLRRGDIDQDGITNGNDVAALHASFGGSGWLQDLNEDGMVDSMDVESLITQVVRTEQSDFDLDRDIDGADFLTWQRGLGVVGEIRYDQGDANLNGVVNENDL
ncbi:MAG: hypothetical protein ABGX16_01735 [Pirellulales bacterium]